MKRIIIIILIFVSITAALTYPFISTVVVEDGNSGKNLAYFKNSKKNFSIRYIHSIHKTPVLETYHTNGKGEIIQTKMQYEEFGIGMPSGAEGNEKFIKKDGKYLITNMDRRFSELDVRVGQVISNHTFIIKGKKYPFSEFSRPGSWVRIKTDHLSLVQWMLGGKVLGER